MRTIEQIQNIVNKLDSRRERYSKLASLLMSFLGEVLEESGIGVVLMESRVKTRTSIQRKLEEKQYRDPEEELIDVCGVRVVTFDLDSVERTCM